MFNYPSLHALFSKHKIFKKDTKDAKWRLTKEVYGEINGLPQCRGCLVATNGILCLIETWTGQLIEGHLDWFIADRQDFKVTKTEIVITQTPRRVDKLISELTKLI